MASRLELAILEVEFRRLGFDVHCSLGWADDPIIAERLGETFKINADFGTSDERDRFIRKHRELAYAPVTRTSQLWINDFDGELQEFVNTLRGLEK